ncbi:MAG: DinB family protein [Ignavibacteriaceae bacterium]|nr:DinB family protein [Ignavibacteriaceae bacterium]
MVLIIGGTICYFGRSGRAAHFCEGIFGAGRFCKSRLLQLAEAMPEDKYNWTPGEGVRTVGEVYMHAAESNYYMLSLIKGEKDYTEPPVSKSDKKTALESLEKSFDNLKETAAKFTDEDLNREIDAFGMKFTVRNFMVTILNHLHEHLGQSIAYARMNGVTPPWSKKGE